MAGNVVSTMVIVAIFLLFNGPLGNSESILEEAGWGEQVQCGTVIRAKTNIGRVELRGSKNGSIIAVGTLVPRNDTKGRSDLVVTSGEVAQLLQLFRNPQATIGSEITMGVRVDKAREEEPLAMLKLESMVRFNHELQPMCLPNTADPRMVQIFNRKIGFTYTIGRQGRTLGKHTGQIVSNNDNTEFKLSNAMNETIARGAPCYSPRVLDEDGRSYLWGIYVHSKRAFHHVAPFSVVNITATVPATASTAATGSATMGPATTGAATTGSATMGPATTGAATTGSATMGPATTGAATTSAATTRPAATRPATTRPATTGPAATSAATTSASTTGAGARRTEARESPPRDRPAQKKGCCWGF